MSHGVQGNSQPLLDELGRPTHPPGITVTQANVQINMLLLACQIQRFRGQHLNKARPVLWESKQLYNCDSEELLEEMKINFCRHSSGLVSITWLYGKLSSKREQSSHTVCPCQTMGAEAVLKTVQRHLGNEVSKQVIVLSVIQLETQRITIHFLQVLQETRSMACRWHKNIIERVVQVQIRSNKLFSVGHRHV